MYCFLGLFGFATSAIAVQLPDGASKGVQTTAQLPVQAFEQTAQQLIGVKLKKVPAVIEAMESVGKEEALPLFHAMLDASLYYQKNSKKLVIAVKNTDGLYDLSDPFGSSAMAAVKKTSIKKIRVNNKIRVQLRRAIARLTLFSKDLDVRENAVRNMLNNLNENNVKLLATVREQESNESTIGLIDLAIALYQLDNSEDQKARWQALSFMEGSLEPIVRNKLQSLLEKNEQGEFLEENALIRDRARNVLQTIDGKIELYGFLETFFFGLSLGSVLLLVATGLAITFGVMGVINMAHGELIMLGAYTTYVIQQLMPNAIEYSLLLAIPAAFIVSGSVGILIERGVIRFLHGRPLETLLATFGISLILQQTVRSIFSPLNRQVETPAWMSGSLEINSIFSVTYNRLYILIFALAVFLLLQLVMKRTSLGLHVRAVSQNRDMAKAMGIRTDWVDAMTFGLGSGIAGIAGVALSQLTNVGPNLGQAYIIDSFMVVVFGGVGNLWGTLVGGFTLGITNKFLEPVTGAVLANILVLVFIILFIQKRPRGLFPQRGRAAG